MINPYLLILYLISAISFILALKLLSSPRSALTGNLIGAIGMLIAIVATALISGALPAGFVLIALGIGAAIGLVLALRIEFTAMPQLVALFNGFGGIASTLVAGVVLYYGSQISSGEQVSLGIHIAVIASGIIGSITLLGSLVAFGKLQGLVCERAVSYRGQHAVKLLVACAVGATVYWALTAPGDPLPYWVMSATAGLLGILLVISIGGADMPVVIALLNSYSGMAATATGFALQNTLLIIAGTMVGASGIILTRIMCRAMNRSLQNVFLGGVGGAPVSTIEGDAFYEGKTKATSADEVAMLLGFAKRVAIVPGYGMAVARAQGAVRVLYEYLTERGVEVLFAIHPVAGRMPGHMNVLLAEENISYETMIEMDTINPQMRAIDVVLVVGANDVVNPLARDDASGPLSGMPIINADHAHTVVVIKRSLSPGFSGAHNPLFIGEHTLMLFNDGKHAIESITAALKENG